MPPRYPAAATNSWDRSRRWATSACDDFSSGLIRRAKYKPEAVDPWLADPLSVHTIKVSGHMHRSNRAVHKTAPDRRAKP
jgi:hypothetical protein